MPWYIGQSADDGVVGEDDGVDGIDVDALDDGLDDALEDRPAVAGSLPTASLPPLLVQPARAANATRATSAGCRRISPVCVTHLGMRSRQLSSAVITRITGTASNVETNALSRASSTPCR